MMEFIEYIILTYTPNYYIALLICKGFSYLNTPNSVLSSKINKSSSKEKYILKVYTKNTKVLQLTKFDT